MSHVALAQYAFGIDRRRIWPLAEPHAHVDVELILMERGRSEHVYRGERLVVRPGELAVYWAGLPHRCVSSDADSIGYVIHLPLAWLLQWAVPQGFVQGLLLGGVCLRRRAASRWLLDRCRHWMQDRSTLDPAVAGDIARLELQAAVHRLAAAAGGVEPTRQPTSGGRQEPMDRVGRMVRYMVHHYRQPLTAAAIAAAAGVHPNHAMRLFSRWMGVRLWDYVARLRLAHAEYLLRTSGMPITDVALEAGFASIGRFYLLFRAQFGTSPRQFRAAARQGEPVPPAAGSSA